MENRKEVRFLTSDKIFTKEKNLPDAEKHDTSRHLNEYTSVDFEMGYISCFVEIMEMETAMLKFTMNYLLKKYSTELECLNLQLPQIESIPVISFREAKIKVVEAYNREIKDWEDFEPEEEKIVIRNNLQGNRELVYICNTLSKQKKTFLCYG